MIGARARYLGIDPGKTKCGIAVVFADGERERIDVVPTAEIEQRIGDVVRIGDVAAILIGHATTSSPIVALCRSKWPAIDVRVVDETNTTYQARERYFDDHPPGGLRRIIPRGLLVPNAPLDGYAALLIVERYLSLRPPQ
jgi:RNase H-fold protein (predicted Holliday junction resolvase)